MAAIACRVMDWNRRRNLNMRWSIFATNDNPENTWITAALECNSEMGDTEELGAEWMKG